MNIKAFLGAALIFVPILIVIGVAVWPEGPVDASSVVILPTQVFGSSENATAAAASTPAVLAGHVRQIPSLDVSVDSTQTADIAVLTTITSDSGILQLNVEVIDTRTRSRIWTGAYHSPHAQYSQMLRVAGEGLRNVLN